MSVSTPFSTRSTGGLQPRLTWPLIGLSLAGLILLPSIWPSSYVVNVLILAFIFAILATGLNLIFGYTGLLSFGQVGFFGLGAYLYALLTMDGGVSPWLSILLAGIGSGFVALLLGYPALRVSRASFVIVTLSFTLLAALLARNWVEITRGPMGIPRLPAPSIDLPGLGTFSGHDPHVFYYIALAIAVASIGAIYLLVNSPIGRVLRAINLDEPLAASQGISPKKYQIAAFAVAGVLSGIAGSLHVSHLGIVDPSIFDPYYSEMLLIIVIVGGPGSFWMVVVSSLVFMAIPELLRMAPELRMVLFGMVLVLAAMLFPTGVGGYFEQRKLALWRRSLRS